MKTGTKIKVTAAFLIIFGLTGFCFWRGWVQFAVPTDSCGVLVSKTGGVYKKPILSGRFLWRWEPLLPTNARIIIFPLQAKTFHKSIQGALPSADIYSLQIQQAPDFSYRFDFDVTLQPKPESLISSLAAGKVQKQEDVLPYLEQEADRIAARAAQFLVAESQQNAAFIPAAYSSEQIIAAVAKAGTTQDFAIQNIAVTFLQLPDTALYQKAKATFDAFQARVDTELASLARKQAESIVADNRAVNKLTKIGETLKKYPELADVLKNSDTTALLKALDTLQ